MLAPIVLPAGELVLLTPIPLVDPFCNLAIFHISSADSDFLSPPIAPFVAGCSANASSPLTLCPDWADWRLLPSTTSLTARKARVEKGRAGWGAGVEGSLEAAVEWEVLRLLVERRDSSRGAIFRRIGLRGVFNAQFREDTINTLYIASGVKY